MLAGWSPAAAGAAKAVAPWTAQIERAVGIQGGWATAVPVDQRLTVPWASMHERSTSADVAYQPATPVHIESTALWVHLVPCTAATLQPWRDGAAVSRGVESSASPATPVHRVNSLPWQEARRVGLGRAPVPPPVPPTPTPTPGTIPPPPPGGSLPTRLHLARRIEPGAPALLWLGRVDPVGIRIPNLRLYIVINKIRMWREGDGAPLDPTSLTISTDIDSWSWSLSAALPDRQCQLLRRRSGDRPIEVGVEVNGLVWRFVVTETSGSRQFGSGSGSITGRSLAVYLSGDYAPKLSRSASAPITARQIADQALENTGTALDWTMADWLVPPGCWSISDAAPMDVITRLAEAAGGTVLAGPDLLALRVSPRYPVLPWEIDAATPDIVLPAGPVKVIGWNDRHLPRCNAVFVAGDREGGIIGHVRRHGTAGDLIAPDIADTLITHVDVARQRGLAALAATGPQADITLQLPMLADLGRVLPNQLLEFEDSDESWRGLIRSVSINVQSSDNIWQTLGVERHFL
ncbi:hypothetical protein [Chitinimonas lacunae]|uniref:DUF4403 family protein n=1 Tax=Chitinimonas lacunae TaxID=1963018 RepID=A0ABV8MX70_9NEIS